MNPDTAIGLLDRQHQAQNDFYAGGSGTALQQPGSAVIAAMPRLERAGVLVS